MADSDHQAQPMGAPLPPGDASTAYINDGDHFEITIKFAPEKHSQSWLFRQDTTFEDILMALGHQWPDYDFLKAKAIVEKKRQTQSTPPGKTKSLLKTPDDDNLPMHLYAGNSLRFMAPKNAALDSLKAGQAELARREAALQAQRRMAYKPSSSQSSRGGIHTLSGPSSSSSSPATADSQYTFHSIRPLYAPHLTNPSRSLEFLQRLAQDPGIRAAMRSHQFTVGLLTEMDPAAHTSADHNGVTRILGLNRNKGEVIELRLRTDAYDGYRDYKTIRNTLCHELAHNVFGEHDRQFWDLCNQITKEVERADYTKNGRTVGGGEYAPARNEVNGGEEGEEGNMVYDHGGWTGGTYVLGGKTGGAVPTSSTQTGEEAGLTRREIMAKAVEERLKRLKDGEGGGSNERREGSGSRNGSQG